MRSIDRLKNKLTEWKLRNSVTHRLEQVAESIADKNRQIESGACPFAADARQHIECADRLYRQASIHFKNEDLDECSEFMEKAAVHLKMAELQLSCEEAPKLEFAESDSVAVSHVVYLMNALVQTKLAIEYSNCVLTKPIQTGVVNVTSSLMAGISQLKKGSESGALAHAEFGIIMLHCVVLELESANEHPILDIRLTRKYLSKPGWRIKEFVDQIVKTKQKFSDALSGPMYETVQGHLTDAEASLRQAIDYLMEGNERGTDSAIAAGSIQLKLTEKLFDTMRAQQDPSQQQEKLRKSHRINYAKTVERLKKAIGDVKPKSRPEAERHLAASVRFYEDAKLQLAEGNMPEATRLARAAYLDLDFARQLVFSSAPATYLEL